MKKWVCLCVTGKEGRPPEKTVRERKVVTPTGIAKLT